MIRKLSAAETEALLSELADRECAEGCECVFCRTFAEGVQSGKHDALVGILGDLKKLQEMLNRIGVIQ